MYRLGVKSSTIPAKTTSTFLPRRARVTDFQRMFHCRRCTRSGPRQWWNIRTVTDEEKHTSPGAARRILRRPVTSDAHERDSPTGVAE